MHEFSIYIYLYVYIHIYIYNIYSPEYVHVYTVYTCTCTETVAPNSLDSRLHLPSELPLCHDKSMGKTMGCSWLFPESRGKPWDLGYMTGGFFKGMEVRICVIGLVGKEPNSRGKDRILVSNYQGFQ